MEELGPPATAHSRHGSREQRALQVHGQGISMRQTRGGVKEPRATSQPLCLLLQASVSPPPPSPNQSYEGSSGYNFRPTDARCLPRSVPGPDVPQSFQTLSPATLFPFRLHLSIVPALSV